MIIDDNCPNKTGLLVRKQFKYKKVEVFILKKNLGVGGATKFGIKKSLKFRPDNIIKIDGDGQHDPKFLYKFINLQKLNPECYIKGYRNLSYLNIPKSRLFGGFIITQIIRVLTFNFYLKDVVNGFISIPRSIYSNINYNNLDNGYFFEQDLIFYISLKKFKIIQTKISTVYNFKIKSSLNEYKVIVPFLFNYIKLTFIKILSIFT